MNERWEDTHTPFPVQAHEFRATELVPGWCTRCGGADFMHPHEVHTCRPETCGGINYDPCEAAWE